MNAMIVTNKRSFAWRAPVRRIYLASSLLAGAALLAGCSGGGDAPGGAVQAHTAQAGGKVMGGRQPVIGSTVTLYAVGGTGYRQATPLSPTTTTASDGTWNINFTCPSAGTEIYVVVTGGNAGGGTNANLALSAMFGPCGEPSNPLPTNANITEVTTVASAYALAQFLDPTGQMPGTSATNATGLANAIATLSSLVNITTGQAQTSTATVTLPASTLNTLANLLASCVNTAGGTSGDGSACGSLFADATPSGGTAPTTSLQAALDIALNPGNNATALYNLTSANGPYQTPAPLSAAPNDWGLVISFSALTSITTSFPASAPKSVAIDAQGNPWFAAFTTTSSFNSGHGAVIGMNPQGTVTENYYDSSIYTPDSIAVDNAGQIWVADSHSGNYNIVGISSLGIPVGNSPFTTANLAAPGGIATDASGNIWVYGQNGFTELLQNNAYTGTDYSISSAPSGLAIDGSGDLWMLSSGTSLLEFSNTVTQIGSTYTGNGLSGKANLVAIDPSNNVWVVNTNHSLNEYVKGASGYTAVNYPISILTAYSMAIDGAGNLWLANTNSSKYGLLEVSGSGVALSNSATGMYTGGITTAQLAYGGLAVDASGNIWAAENNAKVVEYIGLATPVKTPLIGAPQLP